MRWRLWRTTRTSIALAAPQESTKLVGKVAVGEKTLVAPLTGRACACWYLTIDDVGTEGGGRLVEESRGVPFCLTDGDATISVSPLVFRIVAAAVVTHDFPQGSHSRQFLERYLQEAADKGEHQGALAMLRKGWPLRVRETVVCEGAIIAALGLIEAAPRSDQTAAKRITCPDKGPLLLSDVPWLLR